MIKDGHCVDEHLLRCDIGRGRKSFSVSRCDVRGWWRCRSQHGVSAAAKKPMTIVCYFGPKWLEPQRESISNLSRCDIGRGRVDGHLLRCDIGRGRKSFSV